MIAKYFKIKIVGEKNRMKTKKTVFSVGSSADQVKRRLKKAGCKITGPIQETKPFLPNLYQ